MAENKFEKYYSGREAGNGEGKKFEKETNFESERLSLSGSASAESAKARHIKISGSANIAGDLVAESLEASGSLHVNGNINSSGVEISGSLETGGSIGSEETNISGSCRTGLGIYAERRLKVSGSVKARELESAQEVSVFGEVRTDSIRAERVEIAGGGKVGSIACGSVDINTHARVGRLINLMSPRNRQRLMIESIEAKGTATVDACTIGSIRAASVHVGKHCKVGKIAYTVSCDIENGAEVEGEPQKI